MGLMEVEGALDASPKFSSKVAEASPNMLPHRNSWEAPAIGILRLNCMLCFHFGNGLLLASYMLLTLPKEAERMDFENRSVILSSMMLIAGVTQLINPFIGLVSDRCTSSWGRRRPFIAVGGLLGLSGVALQAFASSNSMLGLYYVAYTGSMLSLNTVFTAVVGIVPDLVPPTQTGTATGIAALQTVLGASASFLLYDFWKGTCGESCAMHALYMSYISVIALCVLLTLATVREASPENKKDEDEELEARQDTSKKQQGPLSWAQVRNAYWIDPRAYPDFTFVFWSRTLYYFGVSAQTFFKFYLKDIVKVADPDAAIVKTAIIGQICAACTAIPVGLLSDHLGSMRKPFIYVSCIILATGNIANCFVRNEQDVLIVCGILGLGNGIYLSMDQALAVDTLPSGDEAARYMGVWGIGCFLGGALGPLLGGPILALCGRGVDGQSYNYSGYAIILLLAASGFAASGAILHFVNEKDSPATSSCWWSRKSSFFASGRPHGKSVYAIILGVTAIAYFGWMVVPPLVPSSEVSWLRDARNAASRQPGG